MPKNLDFHGDPRTLPRESHGKDPWDVPYGGDSKRLADSLLEPDGERPGLTVRRNLLACHATKTIVFSISEL